MKGDEREAIERLFHEARELKGADRERFLSHQCGEDIAVRRTIEMLLEEDETAEKFLDTPMLDLISTTLSPGTVLGPYEVRGVAGIGAMGQVYRAHDRRLNRDVAIKALPAEFTLAGEPLARLQREATLLASVNHPNVATIYDVLERDLADSFLILEFVEGPTLAERLSKGPVPLDETLHIAHQIALALEAAHDKGIVHRDLKPANIKLTPNGIVKILDFGLAKVFTDGLTEADPSAAGLVRSSSNTNSSFRGTPAYMSPEQVVGTAVDHRADIWAFGCVVFELLTGRRAFEGNTVSATSASIQEAEPDWSLLPESTPLELRHLLQQCLEKDGKLRPWSASELGRKIESHSAPVLAPVAFAGEPKRETLADRLEGGPLPLDQALRCAIEIADALDKAHSQGIIHLDLTPRNIKLTKSGAKLLDSGPLKLAPVERMPVDSTDFISKGITLETLQYMAPEQIQGKDADARTDIFALGCVLYEMVTAQTTFQGPSEAGLMAAILEHEPPPMSALKKMTPPSLERIVKVCLAKDPEDRWQSARDLCRQLKWVAESDTYKGIPRQEPHSMRFSRGVPGALRRPWKWLHLLLIASVIAGAFVVWGLRGRVPAYRPTARLLLDLQPAERFVGSAASTRPSRTAMALSPDGQTIVFTGVRGTTNQLFKRELGEMEASPMAGTEGARQPFFSPDGQWVGFWAAGKLWKAPIGGGPPVVITEFPGTTGGVFGANWGSGDTIVYSNGDGIFRVPAGGGTPSAVTKTEAGNSTSSLILPHLLPGGKAMLYTTLDPRGIWEQATVVAQSLETGARRTLIQGGADARYVSTGHLVYMKTGTLMAVPFDPTRLELAGSPVAIVDNVMQAAGSYNDGDETGEGQFSVSSNGTMAYLSGGLYPIPSVQPVWVDRKGVATPVPIPPRSVINPRISPDGERIAFHSRSRQSMQSDIWLYDVRRQNTTRLTFQGDNRSAVWSPDNKSIVFTSYVSGKAALFRVSADGSGMPEPLTAPETFTPLDFPQVSAAWSAANNTLAYLEMHTRLNAVRRIWVRPMAGDPKSKPYLESTFPLTHPDFSPDGRWLTYSSNESGGPGFEVWVQPYPGPGEKIRISTNRGVSPVWARSGRELFYQRAGSTSQLWQLWIVDIDTTKGLYPSKPRLLFEGNYNSTTPLRAYDVAPDGQHFLMTRPVGSLESPFTQMHIVLNWTEELKRRAPAK